MRFHSFTRLGRDLFVKEVGDSRQTFDGKLISMAPFQPAFLTKLSPSDTVFFNPGTGRSQSQAILNPTAPVKSSFYVASRRPEYSSSL